MLMEAGCSSMSAWSSARLPGRVFASSGTNEGGGGVGEVRSDASRLSGAIVAFTCGGADGASGRFVGIASGANDGIETSGSCPPSPGGGFAVA